MLYKIEIENNPLPFPIGDSEVPDRLTLPGTILSVSDFEHPQGPFSTGEMVAHKFEVVGVEASFKGSNERGRETDGLPTLKLKAVVAKAAKKKR